MKKLFPLLFIFVFTLLSLTPNTFAALNNGGLSGECNTITDCGDQDFYAGSCRTHIASCPSNKAFSCSTSSGCVCSMTDNNDPKCSLQHRLFNNCTGDCGVCISGYTDVDGKCLEDCKYGETDSINDFKDIINLFSVDAEDVVCVNPNTDKLSKALEIVNNKVDAVGSPVWEEVDENILYNDGNVGIGTDNPEVKLDVNGKLNVSGRVEFGNYINAKGPATFLDATEVDDRIAMYGSEQGPILGMNNGIVQSKGLLLGRKWYFANENDGVFDKLKIDHTNVTRMVIDQLGNIGIGINDPTVKLDVDGIIKSNSKIESNSFLTGSAVFTGNVGIGTNTPVVKLDVNGDIKSGSLRLGTNTDGPAWKLGTTGDSIFRGKTVFLDDNVGIGTTSPGYKLDVNGVMAATIYYDNNNTSYYSNPSSTSSMYKIHLKGTSDASLSDSSGVLRIGDLDGLNMIIDGNEIIARDNGNNSTLYLQLTGGDIVLGGTLTQSSDSRLKTNIKQLSGALDKILVMEGVSFDWKNDGEASIGVIAQDVEKIYPEIVDTNEQTGYKSVNYSAIGPILIEAVKEQQEIIEKLEARISVLENK